MFLPSTACLLTYMFHVTHAMCRAGIRDNDGREIPKKHGNGTKWMEIIYHYIFYFPVYASKAAIKFSDWASVIEIEMEVYEFKNPCAKIRSVLIKDTFTKNVNSQKPSTKSNDIDKVITASSVTASLSEVTGYIVCMRRLMYTSIVSSLVLVLVSPIYSAMKVSDTS